MQIEIDFQSEEALYLQLRNQIILGIATTSIREGDTLPSVRQLAETIGINMHTVNKAYLILKQEGLLQLDRRNGAIVVLKADKARDIEEIRAQLLPVVAKSCCKQISTEEMHDLIDDIYREMYNTNQ